MRFAIFIVTVMGIILGTVIVLDFQGFKEEKTASCETFSNYRLSNVPARCQKYFTGQE